MLKPLALLIGLRYTRAKKKNHFVSFISLSSMLGIGLGVMVLITVLSVMNGFDEEIHKRFFGMVPEITITHQVGMVHDWQALEKRMKKYSYIQALSPFVSSQGLLTSNGEVVPVVLTGILPQQEQAITHLQDKILIGSAMNLDHFGIVLGKGLATNLGVMIGDAITVMIPQASVTLAGMIPRFKRFEVRGIFSAGAGFSFDTKLAFIHLDDAQKLLQLQPMDVTGLRMKVADIYQAPLQAQNLAQQLGDAYQVGDWTDSFGAFFDAIKMEKTMMFLILMLIIGVAAFNLVSTLVMTVNEKQADIAIFRTMGASPGLIQRIFLIQGLAIGLLGSLGGVGLGLLVALNIDVIVPTIEAIFRVQFLPRDIYFISQLPSDVRLNDVLTVGLMAFGLSILATLYPSRRAAKVQPAEALRYE